MFSASRRSNNVLLKEMGELLAQTLAAQSDKGEQQRLAAEIPTTSSAAEMPTTSSASLQM